MVPASTTPAEATAGHAHLLLTSRASELHQIFDGWPSRGLDSVVGSAKQCQCKGVKLASWKSEIRFFLTNHCQSGEPSFALPWFHTNTADISNQPLQASARDLHVLPSQRDWGILWPTYLTLRCTNPQALDWNDHMFNLKESLKKRRWHGGQYTQLNTYWFILHIPYLVTRLVLFWTCGGVDQDAAPQVSSAPRLFIFQVIAEALLSLSALREGWGPSGPSGPSQESNVHGVANGAPLEASEAGHPSPFGGQQPSARWIQPKSQQESHSCSLQLQHTCKDTMRYPLFDKSLEPHLPQPSVVWSIVFLSNFSIISLFIFVKDWQWSSVPIWHLLIGFLLFSIQVIKLALEQERTSNHQDCMWWPWVGRFHEKLMGSDGRWWNIEVNGVLSDSIWSGCTTRVICAGHKRIVHLFFWNKPALWKVLPLKWMMTVVVKVMVMKVAVMMVVMGFSPP